MVGGTLWCFGGEERFWGDREECMYWYIGKIIGKNVCNNIRVSGHFADGCLVV